MGKNNTLIENMLISILCVNRPKHLYVTLDSIFKMDMIEKYPVNIMLLYTTQEMMNSQFDIISHFPINDVCVLYEEASCFWNHLSQFNKLSQLPYDWFLLIEDDIILRKDSLIELNKVGKYAFNYCLYNYDVIEGDIKWIFRQGQGNVFATMYNKASLKIINEWLQSNMAMGLGWTAENIPMFQTDPNNYIWGNDVKHAALYNFYKIIEAVPSKSMCLHFGLNIDVKEELRCQAESKMFLGEKSLWLNNILKVLSEYKHDKDITTILRPYHFEYEEGVGS